MKQKLGINVPRVCMPQRHGKKLAERLGFNVEEYVLLWYLAVNVTPTYDEAWQTKLLATIGRKPKEAARLILAIRNYKDPKRDNPIRKVLLDNKASPPNWMLKDVEIASLVCQRTNQSKLAGKAFEKLVENVQKTRQALAKQYPLPKGKI